MVAEPGQVFLWGAGGRRLTPEEILLERKQANELGQQASQTTPVGHWSAGLNRVLQGLLSGYDQNAASSAAGANASDSAARIAAALGQTGGAVAAPTGASVATPMGGTSIPSGAIDPRLSQAISGAAAANGIDPAYMTRLAMVENGGRINGGSPLSSAQGPFQFLKGTAQQYGLTDPNDPAASANAAARFTLDNKAALAQALGREPTMGELYLAHQQGAAGAAKLLANPDAPVEAVIGAQAAANNGATPGMTAGQFAQKWTGKFADIPQTVDPNEKNIIDAQADSSADPAALPANSAPTQGYVIPGQPAPAQSTYNPAIVREMISSPYASDTERKIGMALFTNHLAEQQKANDPMRTLDMQLKQGQLSAMPIDLQGKRLANMKIERELQGEGATPLSPEERQSYGIPAEQPAYKTRTGEIKFGPAAAKITNNVGSGESAFSKKGSELQATRFNDLVSDGQGARQMMSDISTLVDLGKNIGTGKGAQFKSALGPYAEAAGVKIEGLSDIQAYESIVNRMAPALRVKGSGSQSDTELRNFLKSLPSIGNTTEGNEIVASVMQGLTQNKILAADIASKALNGEISRSDAEKQLRELPDPMQPYRDYKASRSKVDSLLQKYGPR